MLQQGIPNKSKMPLSTSYLNDPRTWEAAIENLLRRRQKYVMKMGWTAKDLQDVEEIERMIKEYEKILDEIYA
jgi:hypothetical protein